MNKEVWPDGYGLNALEEPQVPPTTCNNNLGKCNPDVFGPGHFRESAAIILSRLEKYLSDSSIRGLDLMDPMVLTQAARDLMCRQGDIVPPIDESRLGDIADLYIKTGIQVHSPGYMGRQFSGVIPLAGFFDLIGSIVNQPSSFYEAGQLPNVAERIMAEEFGQFLGWEQDRFAMVTTSGGSLANLTALLAARNDKFPAFWSKGLACLDGQGLPAVAMGENVHYSVQRAVGISGIGEENLVRFPLNRKQQIILDQVEPTLDAAKRRGLNVFCMVASAGTSPTGAFDPMDELADIARERGIWFHVDGAHGASLLVSDRMRHKLRGIEKADSFVWDAHKMMFVPAMCTLLFYRDREKSYGAFQQKASYVFEKEPDIYTRFDSAEQNFECTKRPMIMGLWGLWALYGKELFAETIDRLCAMAREAYRIIEEEPDFKPIHVPESNILCFQYNPANIAGRADPDFQVKIRNRIKQGGTFFISKVDIESEPCLRVVFSNHVIKAGHFRLLLEEVRRVGQEILNNRGNQYARMRN